MPLQTALNHRRNVMRKLLLILVPFVLAGLAHSQSTSSTSAASESEPVRVKGSGTVNFIPKWTGPHSQGNSLIYQNGGNLGVGTTSPQAMLDVFSTEPVAVQGTTTGSADPSVGVAGHARSTATNVYGVFGDTGSTGYGAGVIGGAYATSGTAFGGFFSAASPDGAALFGYASATSGYPIAITGEVESPNGVAGAFKTHAGSGLILLGQSGPSFTNVFSVDAAGNGFYAGNLTVNGTVSKGGGSFRIDDPLDPANKTLSHSFVESPDMMNIYNGNVVTGRHGRATVELPPYFQALNRDFRYQLTVIGQFAQAIVVEKVHDNRFVIETSKPGVEVSWQVTGVRQDAYANAHRIPVEEVKPSEEQGHYLHPQLFGTGTDKGSASTASASATEMSGPSQ
jgi:hypothetical protein